jgi:hypothetical protein
VSFGIGVSVRKRELVKLSKIGSGSPSLVIGFDYFSPTVTEIQSSAQKYSVKNLTGDGLTLHFSWSAFNDD